MSIKKLSFMLLSALSLAALLNGCGSSSKEGGSPGGVARVSDEATCRVCHSTSLDPVSKTAIVPEYLTSAHFDNEAVAGCEGCHGGGSQHNGVGPIPFPNPLASNRCVVCHGDGPVQIPTFVAADFVGVCARCHSSTGGGIHSAQVTSTDDCVICHALPAPQHGPNLVGDNNGVRAITVEFTKWSHHVTGVTLNAAHCAACHLEGTVADGKIVIDTTKHMVDAKTHLRNADDDSEFAWDPATPNHSNMDNFCMSCHDANGATSPMSIQIQAFINSKGLAAPGKTASASNPFGDTISNRYDKMQRPAVVDASSQFNPTNNSHHAVKGKRYSGRTRTAGPRSVDTVAFAANSSALLKGARSTIYDAGNFNALYSPLGTDGTAATGLGDDSTLHCGDCHTVGQWKVGSSDTANGSPTPAAIGAHGSNNEYLLRNTLGTDERHTQNAFTVSTTGVVSYTNPGGAFLVCYNCHIYTRYGSIYVGTGLNIGNGQQPHAGEYDQAGRCNGIGNTIPFGGYTTGKATDGTQFSVRIFGVPGVNSPGATYNNIPAGGTGAPLNITWKAGGEQSTDFGDIFGIQCANCHNSGIGNAYGGIHGSAKNQNTVTQTVDPSVTGGAYIDGMGNTTKIERFLPGLGNAMHVPGTLGGFTGGTPVNSTTATPYAYTTGGISNDANWEQKHWQQTASTNFNLATGAVTGLTSAGAGCYTLGGATAATSALRGPSVTGAGGAATTLLDTWGGCEDHNAAQGNGDHGFVKRIVRPITY